VRAGEDTGGRGHAHQRRDAQVAVHRRSPRSLRRRRPRARAQNAPDEVRQRIAAEQKLFGPAIKAANIKAE
jgi:hypothetical protein